MAVMISDHKSGNIRKYYKISEDDQYNKRRPYHFIAGHRLLFMEWNRGGHALDKTLWNDWFKEVWKEGRAMWVVGWYFENLVE